MQFGALQFLRCCLSVLTQTNSTPCIPSSIILFTALFPAPPTPTLGEEDDDGSDYGAAGFGDNGNVTGSGEGPPAEGEGDAISSTASSCFWIRRARERITSKIPSFAVTIFSLSTILAGFGDNGNVTGSGEGPPADVKHFVLLYSNVCYLLIFSCYRCNILIYIQHECFISKLRIISVFRKNSQNRKNYHILKLGLKLLQRL